MGWYITLGILLILAILPLGVRVKYDEDGFLIKLIAGPVRITLLPRPKKKKEDTKKDKKSGKKTASGKTSSKTSGKGTAQKKKGGNLTDFLPLVQMLLGYLNDFRRRLRVNVLEMKLIMAADDPCDLAVNYGKAWAAVGNLMPQLERVFVIRKRNVQVECDFTETKTKVIANLKMTISLGRLLVITLPFAFRALAEFLKIMNKRKGGAVNEQKSS